MNFKKNNYLDKIEFKVRSGDVQSAYKDFQRLDKRVRDINRISSTFNDDDPFVKDMVLTRGEMNKLLIFPNISKIFEVFSKKLKKFQNFVMDNRWRTLTRTSSRILVKLNNFERYSFPEVTHLYSRILKDMRVMKSTTDSSLLPQEEKRLIKSRLKILHTEMIMLEKYIKNFHLFTSHTKNLKISYKNWFKRVGPEISLEKMAIHQKNKQFALLLLGLFVLTVAFFLVSIFVYHKSIKRMEKKTEDHILDLIKNKLLSSESLEMEGCSTEFQRGLKKTVSIFIKE